MPQAIYLGGNAEDGISLLQNKLIAGKTMIYVCENKTCQLPVEEVSEALKQIKSH